MPIPLNETHDPARRSFVESANTPGCDFPIQNLPFGVFRPALGQPPRVGVRFATPEYFKALAQPLVSGRTFTDSAGRYALSLLVRS